MTNIQLKYVVFLRRNIFYRIGSRSENVDKTIKSKDNNKRKNNTILGGALWVTIFNVNFGCFMGKTLTPTLTLNWALFLDWTFESESKAFLKTNFFSQTYNFIFNNFNLFYCTYNSSILVINQPFAVLITIVNVKPMQTLDTKIYFELLYNVMCC